MSYGKHIRQHALAFRGKPIRGEAEKTGKFPKDRVPGMMQKHRRAEIAKAVKDLRVSLGDAGIAKRLGVPKSSVYVVKMKTGPDGRYSSGTPRTDAELEEIMREGGLAP